ncbi:hypothetical protein [Micromonospora sp. NPDC023956]|uniref:hypothetical protein n=1 Tax=Micromonospora sp. NPDC023956 TaxID=3155722 RepID=UPI0033F2D3E9
MPAPVYATGDVPSATEVNNWFVNVTYARKTATESVTNSITLQGDDHLTVTVDANTAYEMTCVIRYDGDTTGDIQTGWTLPSGTSWDYIAVGQHTSAVNYADDQTAAFGATDTPAFGAIGAGTTCAAMVHGLLVVGGTGGGVQLRWAQRASSATPTRVFAGSYLLLRRVS